MNTRRNFMRVLSGIGAIVATGHAPAIVKSMIAARGTMLSGARGWRNPYMTEVLLAMWDGEWNIGGGEHDSSATAWRDIVGGRTLSLNGSAVFGENYMGTSDVVSGATGDFNLNAAYMELVISIGRTADWFSIIDGLNGKWVWGEPQNYNSSDSGLSWIYWGGATNPGLTGKIQVAMSFDGSVCQFNGTQIPIDMSYADDAIGPFAIFGNVDNIGEERCCHGKCFSARFYSAIPNASQRSANLEIDRERFNLAS